MPGGERKRTRRQAAFLSSSLHRYGRLYARAGGNGAPLKAMRLCTDDDAETRRWSSSLCGVPAPSISCPSAATPMRSIKIASATDCWYFGSAALEVELMSVWYSAVRARRLGTFELKTGGESRCGDRLPDGRLRLNGGVRSDSRSSAASVALLFSCTGCALLL